jgi:hypothetical protein
MAENGILDYQGMNQAIYRGATSNIIVDTQSMSIEIGAGNSSHTSNLHIECDHDANVASIQLNSNVVTEFSRSKKLIKYPRVALTQDDESSTTGYVADASTEESINTGPWKAFNGDGGAWETTPKKFNNTSGDWDGTTTAPYAISLVGGTTIYGEWVELKIPNKIQLHTCRIAPMTHSTYTNLGRHRSPRNGYILGRVGATGNWTVLKSWSDVIHGWEDLVLRDFDIENPSEYYDYFRVVWTAINGNTNYSTSAGAGYASSGEIEFLGVPEYDPEAHGTDVTVKSVANVPNTDWLEVYYDAKDLADGTVSTTVGAITGLGGTTNNGTAYGGVTVSDGAFVLDGTNDYITTSALGFSGDQVHTVSIWFRSDRHQRDMTTENGIYGFGYGNNLYAGLSWWSTETYYDSSLRFWHSGSGGKNFPGTTFLEDKWNHLVLVYLGDGAFNTRVWLNGAELRGVNNPGNSTNNDFIWSTSDTVVIGDWYSGSSVRGQSPWDGSIANFRIFNRALTIDEIYQLYAYQKEDFGHGDLSMTLKAGRLGIGTSEPRAALDVRGTLKVNGPATFTGRPNFTESLFFYTGNTPTNYYASTYKNRHGFYLNTLIPSNSHIGNYGTGGDNQVFTESSYGGGNELCGSHFDCMVYWLKNAPVGHVHRLNWCSNNGSGGSQTYGQKTSGTQIRLWGYWFHTGTYDRDWTGGVDFNISTSTVSVFYEGVTFQ